MNGCTLCTGPWNNSLSMHYLIASSKQASEVGTIILKLQIVAKILQGFSNLSKGHRCSDW